MEDGRWKMEDRVLALLCFDPQSSIPDPRSSILNPQSSILDPRSSILDPRSSILNPRSSILNPRSSILDPRSSILNPQSSIHTRPIQNQILNTVPSPGALVTAISPPCSSTILFTMTNPSPDPPRLVVKLG